MQARVEFEIDLEAAGAHGHHFTLLIKAQRNGQVSFTVRDEAERVICHGSERTTEFARVAQLLASMK